MEADVLRTFEMVGGNVRSSGLPWPEVVAKLTKNVPVRGEWHDLIAPQKVSEMLNVSVRTLGKWRQQNKGPRFTRLGYNKVVYRVQDVLSWVESRPELS